MMEKPIVVLPRIREFRSDCFVKIAHTLQEILLINRSILWPELMMHHAPAIEKSGEQKLHIAAMLFWSKLSKFGTTFSATCLMPKSLEKSERYNQSICSGPQLLL